jgi:hypothetical protein
MNSSIKNISILISELELAINTSTLSKLERNKIVLKLLKLQYNITEK